MKIGTTVLTSLALSIGGMIAMGVIGVLGARLGAHDLEALTDSSLPAVDALAEATRTLTAVDGAASSELLLVADRDMRARAQADVTAGLEQLPRIVARYESLARGEKALALWAPAKQALEAWQARAAKLGALLDTREKDAARNQKNTILEGDTDPAVWDAWKDTRAALGPASKALVELLAQTRADTTEAIEAGARGAHAQLLLSLAVVLAAAAGMSVLAIGVFRKISGTVKVLTDEAAALHAAVAEGRLDARGDPGRLEPEFRPIIEGINETLDAYARPIAVTANYTTRLARGDLPEPIADEYRGDFGVIKEGLNTLVENTRRRGADLDLLLTGALEGRLDVRADANRYKGFNARLIDGMNGLLDAVSRPLRASAAALEQIARGEIPEQLAFEGRGEYEQLKRSLNTCTATLSSLVAGMEKLTRDAAGADVTVDVNAFQGAFRTMAEATRDLATDRRAVRKAMEVVGEFSRGHFGAPMERYTGTRAFISETVEQVRANLKGLIAEVDALAKSAVEGRLDVRADGGKQPGDFKKIVEGFNRILDTLVAPIGEATRTLEALSRRDLRVRVQSRYQGDYARLTDALNATAESLHDSVAQVAAAVEQVSSAATQIASSGPRRSRRAPRSRPRPSPRPGPRSTRCPA